MTRSFTNDPVSPSDLDALIDVAFRGPSAGNTRSLELLVLSGERVAQYWDLTLTAERRASFQWPGLLDAPILIIPTVAADDYVARYSESDKARSGLGEASGDWPVPYWWVDGGAAVENILLAATALDLGACFFGQFEHESVVGEHFGIPAQRRSLGTIAIGSPDPTRDRPSASSQRPGRHARDRTHFDRW